MSTKTPSSTNSMWNRGPLTPQSRGIVRKPISSSAATVRKRISTNSPSPAASRHQRLIDSRKLTFSSRSLTKKIPPVVISRGNNGQHADLCSVSTQTTQQTRTSTDDKHIQTDIEPETCKRDCESTLCKDKIAKLETQLEAHKLHFSEEFSSLRKLFQTREKEYSDKEKDKQIEMLNSHVESLKNHVELLKNQIELLKQENPKIAEDKQVANKEFEDKPLVLEASNIEDVRVVTMKYMNPFAEAQKNRANRCESLLEENDRLKKTIEELKTPENAELLVRIDNSLKKDIRIKMLKAKLERMKNTLKKEVDNNIDRILKLQSQLTALTGFRLYANRLHDMVVFKHIYDDKFKLCFNFLEGDIIEVNGIEKLECREKAIACYKQFLLNSSMPSYPAFLASLTLHLYDKHQSISGSGID